MNYFVYVLANYKNSKLTTYVGYTKDIKKRLEGVFITPSLLLGLFAPLAIMEILP